VSFLSLTFFLTICACLMTPAPNTQLMVLPARLHLRNSSHLKDYVRKFCIFFFLEVLGFELGTLCLLPLEPRPW
jgi:hypothetical protein